MLVLSRKKDEAILIGDNITVMVVEIRGDKVRLGIDAPLNVSVDRTEVRKRKEESRGLAGAASEMEHYHNMQDDQVLQDKMEDERNGTA